jgi:2-keto-3-deoxy-L-rhamnonate aldolase RhmA
MRSGEVLVGVWLSFCDLVAAEIMADVGFDWIGIDSEHVPSSFETIQSLLIGLKGTEAAVLARVPWNDRVAIKRTLDLGVDGVVVPWVNTEEEARSAVAACKYAPEGVRGIGPRRAARYGRIAVEYVEHANEEIFVAVQAETAEAVQNARGIMGVRGVDAVVIGPLDLSLSLGIVWQFDDPKMVAAIESVIEAGKETGVPVGMLTGAAMAKKWIAKGVQLVSIGGDAGMLREGLNGALSDMRDWLEQRK